MRLIMAFQALVFIRSRTMFLAIAEKMLPKLGWKDRIVTIRVFAVLDK